MRLFGKQYTEHSDEKLMQMIAEGDQQAFTELYERYSTRLLNYFYRMLWKDREKAEDFMQELFTKIIHKPHQYNPERPFKTWVYSVANNMCKNEYRRAEIRKPTSYTLDEGIQVSDNGVDVSRKIDAGTFNERLMEELELLDEKKKETFILRYVQDLPIKEIAEMLDCSEGTVKSRLFYTVKHLSDKLKVFDPAQKELKL